MSGKVSSLRLRLTGLMLVVFLAGMVGLYIAAYAFGFTAAQRSYDRLLSGAARAIAETLFLTQTGVELDLPYNAFDILYAAPDDRVFYRIFWSDGVTVTGYADLPLPPEGVGSPPPATQRADALFFTDTYMGEDIRFVVLGGEVREPLSGRSLWVEVGQSMRGRKAMTQELVLRSLIPIALMTALALAVAWFGIGLALNPLNRISAELTTRTPSELEAIRAPVPVEVAPLVTALNDFMARLDMNVRALRDFVGSSAHQLRTPLAALRAQAQAADRDDADDLRRSLDAVDRNAERLSRLVNQMLSDATMSHRSDIGHIEPFDLVHLISETVSEALPRHGGTRFAFTSEMQAAPAHGDPLMLAEAIRNVVHNAVLHANADLIDINLHVADQGYTIRISDRGQGIPDAEKQSALERFRRGGAHTDGAGLGLAIAEQAVRAHRGTIRLLDREGGGLTVELCFEGKTA